MPSRAQQLSASRINLPELGSAAWILLTTTVLLESAGNWVPKQVDPLNFLGRAVGLLAAGAALIILYFIMLQRLEALLWRDWRYFTWGQALLAYFLLIELIDSVFVLPEYVHVMELLTILISVGICSWALTSIMAKLASLVTAKRGVPRVRPIWVFSAWLVVLISITALSLRHVEPLPRPRYQDLILDVAIVGVLAANLWRLGGAMGAATEAGRWLVEASLVSMALGAVAEFFVMLEDVFFTPKIVNVFGYTLTGVIALGVAISGFGYYLLGTTPYREAPQARGGEEPEIDWREFGLDVGREGEVILVEYEPLTFPFEVIASLVSWLRELNMKIVVIARRGTPLREFMSESDLTIQVSPGRMAAPRELSPGNLEVGLSPTVILGIVRRLITPEKRISLVIENVSDMTTLMGLDGAYRLIRALIDMLIPERGVVVLMLNRGAHAEREVNLIRGLATWIINATRQPPEIKRLT